jgi:UDP-N-acetyl-D-glucosamine dehydrogenase
MSTDQLSPSSAGAAAAGGIALKPTLDAVLALLALIALAPLMVLIALAVCFESGTPIFFSQDRLGERGRVFRLYKFRKFAADATDCLPVTLSNDPRLTRVGRLLERSKLDELPQLVNVLKGDMSLVGPRPDTLDFADCFTGPHRRVLEYRPGIFGPNQVFFRNEGALYPDHADPLVYYREVLFPLKARVDIAYFSRRTIFSDAVWIVRGVLASIRMSQPAADIRSRIAAIEHWVGKTAVDPHRPSLAQGIPAGASSALPTVCVQGLGFVGAAMAIAIASARDASGRPAYRVVGVDLPTEDGLSRIEALNRGAFPFPTTDAKLNEKAQAAQVTGNLAACAEATAFGSADVIVVDVPLDVRSIHEGASLDMSTFRAAVQSIGRHMRPDALVIIETTIPPGTTACVARPALEEELSRRGLPLDRFMLAHSYERVMPGAAYFDSIVNMPRVYAGCDGRSAEACEAFLRTVIDAKRYPPTRLPNTNASELAKILENTFRAVTIALMDEWAGFAEAIGVDLYEVVECIRARPTHRNMRTPGFGVGGYCLPKDPLMGLLAAREIFNFDHQFPLALLALEINRKTPERALERIKALLGGSLDGRKLLLLGVSYREGVGDTRCSPSEIFYRAAKSQGAGVAVHDPLVEYWRQQEIPVLRNMPPPQGFDAVVLAVAHPDYKDFGYESWVDGQRPLFFDTCDVLSERQRIRLRSLGCRVECIGRGSPA